jgi:hypothetical protein
MDRSTAWAAAVFTSKRDEISRTRFLRYSTGPRHPHRSAGGIQSNVPAQALALLSDPFIVGQSQTLAKRLLAVAGDRKKRVEELYREALARWPTAEELAAAEEFVGTSEDAEVWADYAHTIFNLKEFLYVP